MPLTALGTEAVVAREAIADLAVADLAPLELLEEVARRVRSVVPYARGGWLATDPATLLFTGAVADRIPPALHLRLIENELVEPDVGKFTTLARRAKPVQRLSDATEGEPERSRRYRELLEPDGYGSELRAVFRAGGACWGVACLARRHDEPDFDDAEVDFVAGLCAQLGYGLRTSLRLAETEARPAGDCSAPGLILLNDDDELVSLGGAAERLLRELPDDGLELPLIVYAVARRARICSSSGRSDPPAHARVRGASGVWLQLHGARLDRAGEPSCDTAVVLEPAPRVELAPLIAELYDLSKREQEVATLLTRGLPTETIAHSLSISVHTLRDHVKAIYAKCGVNSRAELTALLFHEHFAPRVFDPDAAR